MNVGVSDCMAIFASYFHGVLVLLYSLAYLVVHANTQELSDEGAIDRSQTTILRIRRDVIR